MAVACFIAGIGLLTFADAAWAHAIGAPCLFGVIVATVPAIVPQPLRIKRRTFLPTRVAASSELDFGDPATGLRRLALGGPAMRAGGAGRRGAGNEVNLRTRGSHGSTGQAVDPKR